MVGSPHFNKGDYNCSNHISNLQGSIKQFVVLLTKRMNVLYILHRFVIDQYNEGCHFTYLKDIKHPRFYVITNKFHCHHYNKYQLFKKDWQLRSKHPKYKYITNIPVNILIAMIVTFCSIGYISSMLPRFSLKWLDDRSQRLIQNYGNEDRSLTLLDLFYPDNSSEKTARTGSCMKSDIFVDLLAEHKSAYSQTGGILSCLCFQVSALPLPSLWLPAPT